MVARDLGMPNSKRLGAFFSFVQPSAHVEKGDAREVFASAHAVAPNRTD